MSDTKVGILITADAQRDAIHIAVAPVQVAAEHRPGEHVGLMSDGKAHKNIPNKIGIIDPFLTHWVQAGEWCWIFLYPQTVTGMRHHWSHPAFPNDATQQPATDNRRPASEEWLRNYAVRFNPCDAPGEAYLSLLEGLRTGELYAHGSDLHNFSELDSPELLKHHGEIVLGITINWDQFGFSCSC